MSQDALSQSDSRIPKWAMCQKNYGSTWFLACVDKFEKHGRWFVNI